MLPPDTLEGVLQKGKVSGVKGCVGKPEDWFAILKAMIETKLTPDFIVVDGSEGRGEGRGEVRGGER